MKTKVKIIRVSYGLFGRPHVKRIERAINKWDRKRYDLVNQQDEPQSCLFVTAGQTRLTFKL